MPSIQLIMQGDGAFNDVPLENLAHTLEPIRIAALTGRMESGKPSLAIGMFLPNGGGCVVGETSLALFLAAADVFKAKYGDPRDG